MSWEPGRVAGPEACGPCDEPRPVRRLSEVARERAVAVFRALGDPSRLEIFRLVAAQEGALCVCEVTARFDLTQPTVSHHLRVLREAGLVTVSRRGVWAFYQADRRELERLREALGLLGAPLAEALLP